MGLILSAFYVNPYGSSSSSSPQLPQSRAKPSLDDLPESCAALVLAYLDPPEICKLAKLNRAFRGASWADFVWESKLPSNYEVLVKKVIGDSLGNLGKREIYTRLCRDNTFDGGTKIAWLDKRTRGVCLSISSKGLAITEIDDRRYWNHIPVWNLSFPLLRIFNRSGGLKLMESLNFHFRLAPTACSSGCSWGVPPRGLVGRSATLSIEDHGMGSKSAPAAAREEALAELKAIELKYYELKDEMGQYADNDLAAWMSYHTSAARRRRR